MVETRTLHSYGTVGLMVTGVAALTVGADVATGATLSGALAVGGGVAVTVGGILGFRAAEKRGEYDERYLKIWLRGGAVSLWVFYWAVSAWSSIDDSVSVTTPVLEPLTWLMLVPFAVFVGTFRYYDRVM